MKRMTLRQKILDYLRTHPDPFTLKMLAEETGGKVHSIRFYLSGLMQDGAIGYAEKPEHDHTPTEDAPWGRWKERKYKPA